MRRRAAATGGQAKQRGEQNKQSLVAHDPEAIIHSVISQSRIAEERRSQRGAATKILGVTVLAAALLTILGYSVNDTVVVSDRIRENLRKFKKLEITSLLNRSINETLARTLMTSLTTLTVLVALYILGGEVIRNFTFAMMFGVIIGTYSSIFIAAPLLAYLGVKRDWSGVTRGAPAAAN